VACGCESRLAVSTRLRPAFSAPVESLSAACNYCSTSCALGAGSATPMLTVTDSSPVADSAESFAHCGSRGASVAFLSSFLRPPSRRLLRRSGVEANSEFRFLNRNSERIKMRHNFFHGFSAKENGELFPTDAKRLTTSAHPEPILRPPCSKPGLRCPWP